MIKTGFFLGVILLLIPTGCSINSHDKTIKVLILTERGGQHESFVAAALEWLEEFGKTHHFTFKEFNHASELTEDILKNYDVFIQLDYPPYMWSEEAEKAFIQFIEEGRIGWIGFHHATLLGEFDGYPMWEWFSGFMGGIRFKNYVAATATALVNVEDSNHPVMEGVDAAFDIPDDEWYTFDKNPRSNVHVLASVDESTYRPDSEIKMGDHPAIWTNEKVKARNVYFLMGHSGVLFTSGNFKKMFANALLWTGGK